MSAYDVGAQQETAQVTSGPRAGFWQRFGASFLDGILVTVVNIALVAAVGQAGTALSVGLGLIYYTVLEGGAAGQTLGKRALGIRVISHETGGPIGYGRALVRYLGRIVSAIVLFLGYLWMLWDGEKQTWHDKMAGSVVVPVAQYPV